MQGEVSRLVEKSVLQEINRMLAVIKDDAARLRTKHQFRTFIGLLALQGEMTKKIKNCELSPVGQLGTYNLELWKSTLFSPG